MSEPVYEGAIYLYETDQRIHVSITEKHKQEIRDHVEKMRSMTADEIPPLVDNPNKCEKCSTRQYCMPMETAILEPDKARDTGWEDAIQP